MTLKQNTFDQEQKAQLRAELSHVRERYEQITREHLFDDSLQRVVLTLPKSIVHLAKFLSIMADDSPKALSRWQSADGIGRDEPTLQRNLNRKMRQFLENEMAAHLLVKMAQLQAECQADSSE